MAGSLSPEAGRSQGGGCNRDLCAEKWGTLFPQLFPSSPSSPCLETLVTSPLAQSFEGQGLSKEAGAELEQNVPLCLYHQLVACPALSAPLRFPSSGCRGCDRTPPLLRPPLSRIRAALSCLEGRSPAAGVSGVRWPGAGALQPALPLPGEARPGDDTLLLCGLPGAPSVPTQPRRGDGQGRAPAGSRGETTGTPELREDSESISQG